MGEKMDEMENFKCVHSELLMWMQYIEQDLKIIYATIKDGKFEDNYLVLKEAPLGRILKEFKELDAEKGFAKIKPEEYEVLEEIRERRNYWAHQCYLDFHYIENELEKRKAFDELKKQLSQDEDKIFELQRRIQKLRENVVKKYKYKK